MRHTLILCITLVTAGTLCAQNFSEGKMDSLFTILKQKDKYMGSIALSENGKIIYTNAVGFADIEAVKKADTRDTLPNWLSFQTVYSHTSHESCRGK